MGDKDSQSNAMPSGSEYPSFVSTFASPVVKEKLSDQEYSLTAISASKVR